MNNTLILRDYQQDAIDAIWNEILRQQTALCVMSTGLGKTEVLIGLIKKSLALKSDLKVVFLVNKLNLLGQTERRIVENLGDIVGMFYGKEKNLQKNVTVASIQSLHKIDLHVNFLILDEVHNVDQNNGRYLAFIDKCRVSNPKLKIIGVTATAFRADGYIYGPGKMFNRICFDRGLLWAIHNKHLVTPRLKAQSEKFDTSKLRIKMGEYHPTDVLKLTSDEIKIKNQLVSAIPQLTGRKKIVWATSSIEHCRLLFKQLVEMETAAMVHSKQNDEQNAYNIKLFEKGDCRHLVFVTIVSEGYDFKPIDAVVLMRPTRSPVLYVQTIGRGLRPFESKEDCLVLDFGGVVESCGPIDSPIIKRKGKKAEPVKMKFCPTCLEYCDIKADECPCCGTPFPLPKAREVISKAIGMSNNTDANLLSLDLDQPQKSELISVRTIEFCRHLSKAGNLGKKIVYRLNNSYPSFVTEYFNPEWGMKKYQKRAFEFGVHEDEETQIPGGNIFVEVIMESGFWVVKNVEKRD